MDEKKPLAELLKYGVAGVTTTLVNLATYHIFLTMGVDYRWAELIALISSKVYGYIVNKLIVFCSHRRNRRELLAEIGSYITARGFTGVIDYFGLVVMVELFDMGEIHAKYIIQAIVIVVNYVFGKFWVFRHKGAQSKED